MDYASWRPKLSFDPQLGCGFHPTLQDTVDRRVYRHSDLKEEELLDSGERRHRVFLYERLWSST